MSFLYAPDTSSVDNGDLSSVTWSEDGTSLAAGGTWDVKGECPIRRWAQAGKGKPQDRAAASSTIMDLRPLPGGGILFGAGDPAWGVLSASGQRSLHGAPPLADYRGLLENFLLSADGTEVAFGFEPLGKSPARFSIPARELSAEGSGVRRASPLSPPRTDDLPITGWETTTAPKLAGKPLTLRPYEMSRSLAIARDASGFVLGASRTLQYFSATGEQHWHAPAPGEVWAVNLTADGRLAVAAYGDGTIRWHDVTNGGRELLAFFPHKDPQTLGALEPGLREIALFHNEKRLPPDGPGRHGARGNQPLQTLSYTVTLAPGENEFYLIPHDVTRMYGDPELLAARGVSRKDLEEWCAKVPARKQLMLLDTCQSGGLVDAFAMRGIEQEKAIAQLARATGTVVIASTGAEAYARESKEIGHGIFTKAVLDGLAGKADGNKDGKITVKEVEAYINEAVPELSKKLMQTPQFPTSYARGQDFPIGLMKP